MYLKQFEKIKKRVLKIYPDITVENADGCVRLSGTVPDWHDVVSAGKLAVSPHSAGVVNDLCAQGINIPPMRLSEIRDAACDGLSPDVLVIGGGVIGCAVLRQLSRYKLNAVLIEKEDDVATAASARNDGVLHSGIDLTHRCKKLEYLTRSKPLFENLSRELNFKYKKRPHLLLFASRGYRIVMPLLFLRAKKHKIKMELISKAEAQKIEPRLSSKMRFAAKYSESGTVSPYEMTIAFADNAVQNGAQIVLSCAATAINAQNGQILSVETNRGTIYPRVVVNAAGVWADKVAEMAGDRFYTIHARRGTSCILDRGDILQKASCVSMYGATRKRGSKKLNTKGGGVIPTLDANMLVGPDAVETHDREDTSTRESSINLVLGTQRRAISDINKADIITYFTGVRASTYEEDFVLQKGRRVKNLVHAAGIQSPGLTAAPAIAENVSRWAFEILGEVFGQKIEKNAQFNPVRKGLPRLNSLSDGERNRLIQQRPDYGEIVCRCEAISKGEILDALNLPLKVYTIDAIKRRARSGMGRCQGGFCQPLVLKIIAEAQNAAPENVVKKGGATVLVGDAKLAQKNEKNI